MQDSKIKTARQCMKCGEIKIVKSDKNRNCSGCNSYSTRLVAIVPENQQVKVNLEYGFCVSSKTLFSLVNNDIRLVTCYINAERMENISGQKISFKQKFLKCIALWKFLNKHNKNTVVSKPIDLFDIK